MYFMFEYYIAYSPSFFCLEFCKRFHSKTDIDISTGTSVLLFFMKWENNTHSLTVFNELLRSCAFNMFYKLYIGYRILDTSLIKTLITDLDIQ